MILPSARWYAGLLVLAAVWLGAFIAPATAPVALVLDLLWIAAILVDAFRADDIDVAHLPLTREAPPAFSVGRPAAITYWWTNTSSRARRVRVRDALPPSIGFGGGCDRVVTLGAATVTPDRHEVVPHRRGRDQGGRLDVRILGPWGLAWRQRRRVLPWHIVVYPALRRAALRELPASVQRHREAGARVLRQRGEGRAFESLKEWVPGEDTRRIDWKATARRRKVMMREYEDERRQDILLVIDAGRLLTADIDGRPRLDAAVDAALTLAYSAVLHDDNIGLLAFADTILHYSAPARGRRALRQVLDALAGLEGRLVESNYPAAFSWLATHQRRRALTVCFTDVIDQTASDALLAQVGALRPRHFPLLVTLRDPSLVRTADADCRTVEEAFERAAAEELLEARYAALEALRARGVRIADTAPDAAARVVVDQYRFLKRRGMV